jgi:hypothetical protein
VPSIEERVLVEQHAAIWLSPQLVVAIVVSHLCSLDLYERQLFYYSVILKSISLSPADRMVSRCPDASDRVCERAGQNAVSTSVKVEKFLGLACR